MPKGIPAKLTSGACHDHRIGTREQYRQGFALDGRGCPVAKSLNASEDRRGKIERLKSSSANMLGFVLWVAGEGQHGGGCVKWEAPSADWLEGRSSRGRKDIIICFAWRYFLRTVYRTLSSSIKLRSHDGLINL